ncbi:hypothetical protein HPG69_002606 [Diceros bicornis minor]|uniref:FHA domain-containing protein n=1 Tax=Diceros bicornis minor TaxID=77932 RepID=A0A7J7EV29_DICBM|nr:hypothetical protein HPG69_002606 [Diceros bicornis minor]
MAIAQNSYEEDGTFQRLGIPQEKEESSCDAGQAASNAITLQGLGISDKHTSFTNLDGKVTVTPHSKCKVVVNGVPITTKTKLQHLVNFPAWPQNFLSPTQEPGEVLVRRPRLRSCGEGWVGWALTASLPVTFPQMKPHIPQEPSERLAVASGGFWERFVLVCDFEKTGGEQQWAPAVPAQLLAQVTSTCSQSLHLPCRRTLGGGSAQLSQAAPQSLTDLPQMTLVLPVTGPAVSHPREHAGKNHRNDLLEQQMESNIGDLPLYFQEIPNGGTVPALDGEDSHVAQEDDPFWDPVEAVHLGSAHVWLQSLAHCVECEEQVELVSCDRLEAAVLRICMSPCAPTGQACGGEDVVIDPLELLGKRMDFEIRIVRCLGVKWLKEDTERGPVWKIVNPQIEDTVQFAALNASQEFLNYLQTNALIVDFWGLQEGCAELSCSQPDLTVTGEVHIMVDTTKIATVMSTGKATSNPISELYLKLLKLEQETELLRNINRTLREENVLLKGSLEKTGSSQQAHKPSNTLKHEHGKGQFLRLRHFYKPPEDDQMLRPFVQQQSQMLKDFGDLLESSLWKLKNDVALIIKKNRDYLTSNNEDTPTENI